MNTQSASDVNYRDERGNTPLHRACKEGFFTIASLLIERNADVTCKGDDKNTTLHYACRHGHTNIAEMLIKLKAIINCNNSYKITPLHYASARRNADIAKMLVEQGANVNCKDSGVCSTIFYLDYVKSEDGVLIYEVEENIGNYGRATPLHIACAYGHVDITKILVENGAIVNCEDKNKQTPLHFACANGHWDKAKILIDNKATVNCKDKYKFTPLHLACKYGFTNVVRLLLDNNAGFNSLNECSKMPIHEACKTKIENVDDVKLIPTHSSDSVINNRDEGGRTMLHLASQSGNIEIVKMLLELGADINLTDIIGSLPIHDACRTYNNNIDIMKLYLIDLNVDVNCADKYGQTPLHVASDYGVIDNVKFLVEHGADINVADDCGNLPIHLAAISCRCSHDVINFYLDLKIDVNCRNKKDGQTPLHYASEYGRIKRIKFLLDHNADASITDYSGETALHKLVQAYSWSKDKLKNKEPEIIEILKISIDRGAYIYAKNNSGLSVLDLEKVEQFDI